MKGLLLLVVVMLLLVNSTSTTLKPIPLNNKLDESSNNGLETFRKLLAQAESGCNPMCVSKSGYYRGLYQIGRAAAQDADISYDYLLDSSYSEIALIKVMQRNKELLGDYSHYLGKVIDSVRVTEAGILAAAHLRGHVYARKWLETNGKINGKDANGTSVKDYMELMQGIEELKLNENE